MFFSSIRIAAIWRKDAKIWISERNNLFENLTSELSLKNPKKKKTIWIHVSSLGEFEQGRNLIEKIKNLNPDSIIILSFFSPSGYKIQQKYPYADVKCYFPSDNRKEITKFIELINPKLVIFVKYDFWFNTLRILDQGKIPYFFISVHLSENSYLRIRFFKNLLNELKNANKIFLQEEENLQFFKSRGFTNVEITGDTRVDRVFAIAQSNPKLNVIENFKNNKKLLVLGSAWPKELQILNDALSKEKFDEWKIIIAPHLVNEIQLAEIEQIFYPQTCRYSSPDQLKKIMIVDRIGLLSKMYRYADLAFVGGGFGKGIHNTLEPIAHQCPVCFGPIYEKFPEAVAFINLRIGQVIQTHQDLIRMLHHCEDQEFILSIKNKITNWMNKRIGATDKIYQQIQNFV